MRIYFARRFSHFVEKFLLCNQALNTERVHYSVFAPKKPDRLHNGMRLFSRRDTAFTEERRFRENGRSNSIFTRNSTPLVRNRPYRCSNDQLSYGLRRYYALAPCLRAYGASEYICNKESSAANKFVELHTKPFSRVPKNLEQALVVAREYL